MRGATGLLLIVAGGVLLWLVISGRFPATGSTP